MVGAVPALGDPITRVDARLKVTGQAQFPSDVAVAHPAYAILLTSTIARGRIAGFDLAAAQALPGVRLILTHENTTGEMKTPRAFAGESTTTVEDDRVMHDGQIIGLVVADSLEAAREAAALVEVRYAAERPSAGFDAPGAVTEQVRKVNPQHEDAVIGDAHGALARAPVRIAADYETPTQHHNSMELFTTTCLWEGDRLTVHEPSQFVLDRDFLAKCFDLPVDHIRVISRFCGGGFGGKHSGSPRTVLVAIAARRLGRPVKLVATRDQGFTIGTYRAETRHRIELGADHDGRLVALVHEGTELTSRPSTYSVSGTETTARMYACPNIATDVRIVHADRNTPGFMRCPAEMPYMFALESGMDELAHRLALDPIELRRRNDTQTDPIGGKPFSTRGLMRCFDHGAERFGWSARATKPGMTREGDWLVGLGCATACYPTNVGASAARVTLAADGRVRVQVAFHEIGNGAYTVVAQTAAARLGVPVAHVAVELGDTDLPPGIIAAASCGTASTCNAVADACEAVRARLAAAAAAPGKPLAGIDPSTLVLTDGLLGGVGRSEPLHDAVARVGGLVEATGSYLPPNAPPGALQRLRGGQPIMQGGTKDRAVPMYAFGAQFVEVRVHARTAQLHVARALGVFAAGRIMNRRTAHSQLIGGMTWGLSAALLEETSVNPGTARYLNDNLADYLIPTNLDVGAIDAEMLEEVDTQVNPLGIKGIGEIGACGMNAAVANAIFNATDRRIRTLPIRPRDLV